MTNMTTIQVSDTVHRLIKDKQQELISDAGVYLQIKDISEKALKLGLRNMKVERDD